MRLFDTHAHLLDGRFDEDRHELITELPRRGVELVMECATDAEDIHRAVALARAYENVFCAVGVHPHSAEEYDDAVERSIREYAKDDKVLAVGEIGLDYHYDFCPRDLQREVLARQLSLAKELSLPVSLHSRESTQDMLDVLAAEDCREGVMHCFSGSVETAKILLDPGLYLGIGGTLTFKNAVKAIEVVEYAPLDRMLLETDSPYLAPVPLRGKRNDPANTRYVAEKIAEIKKMDAEEVAELLLENGKRLFRM